MGNPTATLEREGLTAMNAPGPQLDEADQPRAAMIKFTHPSGSRPLEGYTIKRGVGRGGFGEVYFATSDAGKEVALKLIRRNLEVELRGVSQCLNLKHPNLIALYDIRTDSLGDQWVVMEYVSGESLEDVIERNPQGMPVDEALRWMRGMCAGVAYLHDHGIVHRDLKPGNIFIDEGTVKIGDYGLAKFISCSRRSGQTESVGTVHYMAPEIANGRYGREIDTYALGIILFEMLTGRVPFEGESVGEVLMKHLTAEPDLSILSQPYRGIVERALAKDPDVRLKSVGELMALLPDGVELPAGNPPAFHHTPHASEALPVGNSRPMPNHSNEQYGRANGYNGQDSRKARQFAQSNSAKVEEPIWKAIRDTFSRDRFHGMPPLMQAAILFALVFAGMFYWAPLLAFAPFLLVTYLVYYLVWTATTKQKRQPAINSPQELVGGTATVATQGSVSGDDPMGAAEASATEKRPADPRGAPSPLRRQRSNWRERAQRLVAKKPLRVKLTELTGSMLAAAIIAACAACTVPLVFRSQPISEQWAATIWLAIVGTVGSWCVLVPAKLSEGVVEDQAPLRITYLVLGAALGAGAWFLGNALMLKIPGWRESIDVGHGLISHEMLRWPQPISSGNPPLVAYAAYFAFLLLVPRWWRQAEFTRDSRLSLWTAFVCAGWAWLLHAFWWFPQPMGMMTAITISLATQFSSPWMRPSQRRELSQSPINSYDRQESYHRS